MKQLEKYNQWTDNPIPDRLIIIGFKSHRDVIDNRRVGLIIMYQVNDRCVMVFMSGLEPRVTIERMSKIMFGLSQTLVIDNRWSIPACIKHALHHHHDKFGTLDIHVMTIARWYGEAFI